MDANKMEGQPSSLTANEQTSTARTSSNSPSRSSGNSDGSTKKRRRSEGFVGSMIPPSVVATTSTEDESKSHGNNETILVPRYKDILLGRGRGIQTSNGNYLMREIVRKYRAEYTALPRSQRREISERVLDEILATGARFLRRVENDTGREYWQEVDRSLAHEKVSHALREKKYTGTMHDEEEQSSVTRNPVESHQSRSPSTVGENMLQHDHQRSIRIPLESQHPSSSVPPLGFPTQQPNLPHTTQQSGSPAQMLLPFQSVAGTIENNATNTPPSLGSLTQLEGQQNILQPYQQSGMTTPFLLDNNYSLPSSVAAGLVLESLIHQQAADIASASQNLLAGALGGLQHSVGLLGGATRRGGPLTNNTSSSPFLAAAAAVQQMPQSTTPPPGMLAFILANNNALLPQLAVQALQQELAQVQRGLNSLQSVVAVTDLGSLAQNNNMMIPPRSVLEQGRPEAGSRLNFLGHGGVPLGHQSNSAGVANARELSNPALHPSSRYDSSNVSSFSTGEAASSSMNDDDDESNEQSNKDQN